MVFQPFMEMIGQTVIILGNGHTDTSSNPEQGSLGFTFMLMPVGKAWIHLLPPAIIGQTKLFNVGMTTSPR